MELTHFGKEVDVAVFGVYNESHNFQMFFPCALKMSVPVRVQVCMYAWGRDCGLMMHIWEKIGWMVVAEK